MATITNAFDSYKLFYYSGPTPLAADAMIQVFQAGTMVGQIAFHASPPLPANSTITPSIPYIHYFLSQFPHVIGILRLEKPLFLFFDDVSKIGFVATAQTEPVGADQGV